MRRVPGNVEAPDSCQLPTCQTREVKILLSAQPLGCDEDFTAKWYELLQECGTLNGKCCSRCTVGSPGQCDESYTGDDTVYATAYTAVATILILNALTG